MYCFVFTEQGNSEIYNRCTDDMLTLRFVFFVFAAFQPLARQQFYNPFAVHRSLLSSVWPRALTTQVTWPCRHIESSMVAKSFVHAMLWNIAARDGNIVGPWLQLSVCLSVCYIRCNKYNVSKRLISYTAIDYLHYVLAAWRVVFFIKYRAEIFAKSPLYTKI